MGEKKNPLGWRGAEERLQLCTAHHWKGRIEVTFGQQDVALSTG